jgi:hypothetical protein
VQTFGDDREEFADQPQTLPPPLYPVGWGGGRGVGPSHRWWHVWQILIQLVVSDDGHLGLLDQALMAGAPHTGLTIQIGARF